MIEPSSERMMPFGINVLGDLDHFAMVAAALPDRYQWKNDALRRGRTGRLSADLRLQLSPFRLKSVPPSFRPSVKHAKLNWATPPPQVPQFP